MQRDSHPVSNEEYRLRKLNAIPESDWEYKKSGAPQASEGNTEGPEQEGSNPVLEDVPEPQQAPPSSVTEEEEVNVTDCSHATLATPSKIEQNIPQGAEKEGDRSLSSEFGEDDDNIPLLDMKPEIKPMCDVQVGDYALVSPAPAKGKGKSF